MPLLLLFSHMIATPLARAPASAACHRRVRFLRKTNCACALSDKRAVRFESETSSVELGCDAVGPASRSSSKGESDTASRYDLDGFIAGMRIGRALRRNLYMDAKVPG
jgi:hypothetical protein